MIWYVGKKPTGRYEVFSSASTPSERTHGRRYGLVSGPMRTRGEAEKYAWEWNEGPATERDMKKSKTKKRYRSTMRKRSARRSPARLARFKKGDKVHVKGGYGEVYEVTATHENGWVDIKSKNGTKARVPSSDLWKAAQRSPVRRTRESNLYQVWGLDVWGNEEDGFTVNDRYRIQKVRFPNHSSTAVIRTLKREGLLKKHVTTRDARVEEWGEEDFYLVDAKTDEPIFQLEKVHPSWR